MDQEKLLDEIVQATITKNSESEIVRVSNQSELQEIIQVVEPNQQNTPKLSEKEQFHLDLYHEVLDEISFTLHQIDANYKYGGFSLKQFHSLQNRLENYIKATMKCKGENEIALKTWFHLSDEEALAGGIYTLASFQEAQLDQAIILFARVEEKFLPSFIFGLQHATNKHLSKYLPLLLETSNVPTQIACLKILYYRADAIIKNIESFLEHQESENKTDCLEWIHLILSSFQVYNSVNYLFQQLENKTVTCFQNSLEQVLQNHPKGLPLCRSFANIFLEEETPKYSISLFYLIFSGTIRDAQSILKTIQSDPNKINVTILEALGYLGLPEAIPLLIEELKKEQEDEIKTVIIISLKIITGIPKELEQEDETQEEPIQASNTDIINWNNWFDEYKNKYLEIEQTIQIRYRYGKELSFFSLIEIMENFQLPAQERQFAWLELRIRSNQNIAFNATWNVNKQLKSIQAWKNWQKRQTYLHQQIWQYQGRYINY